MAIQISYPTATIVTLGDRLLGTQYDSETGAAITKNFAISSIVSLAQESAASLYAPLAGATFTGNIIAPSFIKAGGTSVQFLMANGSTSTMPTLQQIVESGNTIILPTTVAKGIDITLANQTSVFQNGISVTIPTQTGAFPTYSPAPDAFVANINGQTPGTLIGSVVGFLANVANDDNIAFFADLTATSATSRGFEVSSFDAHTGDYFVARKYIVGIDSVVFKVANNGDTTTNSITTTIDSTINGLTIGKGGGAITTNTVLGRSALFQNVAGTQTTAIGNLALNANTANNNTAVGFKAMTTNTTGNTNTSVGSESLQTNLSGNENSAFGYRALYLATSAVKNNAVGRLALGNILTGNQNVGIGNNAGLVTPSGNQNTTSDFSVYIGNDTKPSLDDNQNEIVIGYNANGLGSNSVVLGNGNILTTVLRGQTLIGTTTVGAPTYGSTPQLVVANPFSNVGGVIDIRNLNTNIVADSLLGRIQFTGKSDAIVGFTSAAIEVISTGSMGTGNNGGGALKFMTSPGTFPTNPIERMRIAQNGTVQPGTDNSYSLGASGIRWSAVWAANGTIQTSDEREKKDIVDSDLGLDFISKLRPVSFKWKVGKNEVTSELDGLDEEGNPKTKIVVTPIEGKRTHYGLIAQEVEAALEGKDFGGFIHDKETDIKGLRYDQLIPVMINAIKELKAEIELLKSK